MAQHQGLFRISALCRVLSVSRSGYYEWLSRPLSEREQKDQALKVKIKRSHEKGRRVYGTRRIKMDLSKQNETVSRRRISRLMKEESLSCITRRKFKVTTDSRHNKPVAQNLLDRQFQVEQPNQVYVGDITYIPTREGWLYLAVFIDLYSRAVVGWSMNKRMQASLVTDALTMAVWQRQPRKGLLVHTDRGSQYVSASYQGLLHQLGFRCSMSRKGNCWDNAPSESFFHTLKTERVHREDFQTREEAKRAIFEYIEVFYNRERLHSTNGYIAPLVFEEPLSKAA
nr:IS3 family transposase [Amphritea opalescens]